MKHLLVPLFIVCGIARAHAHIMAIPTPEVLVERAEIVCNGIPETVVVTAEKAGTENLPTRVVVAKIKVIGKIKGEVPDEIELRFPQIDWKALDRPVINAPTHIAMEAGKRYRFFLKKAMEGYVGVLDGEYDDGSAVQPMGAKEGNGDAPLFKKEAVEIAIAYYHQSAPDAKIVPEWIDTSHGSYPPAWEVRFWSRKPLDYPKFTHAAVITVLADKTIDPSTWIGAAFPVEAAKLDKSYIGKEVRMMVHTAKNSGSLYTVRGRIQKIDAETVTGDFTSTQESIDKASRRQIERALIDSVQPLLELP